MPCKVTHPDIILKGVGLILEFLCHETKKKYICLYLFSSYYEGAKTYEKIKRIVKQTFSNL
jgi:hypothetical protein